MDFRFSCRQEEFRREVLAFLRTHWEPLELGRHEMFRDEHWQASLDFRKKLSARGWVAIGWPREYGGMALTTVDQMIFHEEMVYFEAPLDSQTYQLAPALIDHGSTAIKEEFLPALKAQRYVWCQGFSEPNAGSDLASLQTTAVRDGDVYSLTGTKIWTSYADRADWCHLLARTGTPESRSRGLSYFLVDMRTPGITIRPLTNMMGEQHFCIVTFDRVQVPRSLMIGADGEGWSIAMTTLGHERSGIRDVASARRLLDRTIHSLADRTVADRIKLSLVDTAIGVEVGRLLAYRAGWMMDQGFDSANVGSMAKLIGAELQQRIASLGVNACSLQGQIMDREPFRSTVNSYLWTTIASIGGGSSEVVRDVIGKRHLGLGSRAGDGR